MKNIAILFALAMMLVTSAHANEPVSIRGIDHVGLTVPSIKEVAAFFTETFGCHHVTTIGPFPTKNSRSVDRKELVAPRSSAVTIAMLRCGTGSNIELFEYENSKGKTTPSNHEDLGFQHIAFYTDDIERATKQLKERGLTILGEPMLMTSGDTAGETWVHFMSPWGIELELVQSPKGKAYEKKNPAVKLWSVRKPLE